MMTVWFSKAHWRSTVIVTRISMRVSIIVMAMLQREEWQKAV